MAEDKNRDEQADLKRREYEDKEGNVHHHTHPYMEEHGGERGRSRSSANDTATAERKQSGSSSESGAAAHPLTDHDEIRRWAEARGAKPACVRGTGGKRGKDDPGMIRLDFPGWSGAESLESISWDVWFRAFDENNLALLVQDKTAGREKSNFNKLVKRTDEK